MIVWGVDNHVMAYIVIHVRVNNVELVLQMDFVFIALMEMDSHSLVANVKAHLQIISEELAEYINSPSWNRPAFYDDDDEYSIQYKEYLENSSNAIAPVLPTEEPEYSLSMRDEHFSTIPEIESDEVKKSSVENLVPIPSEFEVTSDNEKSNSEISDATIESLSLSPIPVEDSDSQMEEIDLFLATDDLMPPGIENDDYDSEGDIYFLEELLSNDTLPLPKNESSNFDHHDYPLFPPLNLEDHSCGGYAPNIAMKDFKECVNLMEVMDVNATGLHFIWNEKPHGEDGILKKIDRVMSNIKFLDE
nr:RNA-directed DNA polymerase, eukaryota, reverse transcriptase zinc-binding domain protein [Tanacetum cinerariifolium]